MSEQEDKEQRKRGRLLQLSGIGIQMAGTIFLGAYLGRWLDEKYPSDKKWFTIGLTILAVILSMYSILKKVNELNRQDDEDNK
ncbi:AtpZ/AtpI family protein [Crocinitomicaceae bacterium]|nr:AtpZ/AtpI family protein [Crocinitomicaceae bacterium]